jgi:release factor glutamine methyltransferase
LNSGPHPERARADAELLLLHLLGKDKAWLMTHLKEELAANPAALYIESLERRSHGEPIQYITGECEFYSLSFRVTPDVLIPRPETEHLVEKVLALAANFPNPRIVDVGTGSGAIAVALAHTLSKCTAKSIDLETRTGRRNSTGFVECTAPGNSTSFVKGTGFSPYINPLKSTWALAPEGRSSRSVTAIDLSATALTVAEENAKHNGVTIRFLQGNLLTPVAHEQFEIIVSNPPYIPATDRDSLSVEVRDHEPSLALFAGPDGLDIYRRLIPQAFSVLVPGGFLALEIGYHQSPAILDLLHRSGFEQIEFIPDLQGIPRVAGAQRP